MSCFTSSHYGTVYLLYEGFVSLRVGFCCKLLCKVFECFILRTIYSLQRLVVDVGVFWVEALTVSNKIKMRVTKIVDDSMECFVLLTLCDTAMHELFAYRSSQFEVQRGRWRFRYYVVDILETSWLTVANAVFLRGCCCGYGIAHKLSISGQIFIPRCQFVVHCARVGHFQ